MKKEAKSKQFDDKVTSEWPGAILANGRGGRETTRWTSQKKFFNIKIVIFVFKLMARDALTKDLSKIQQIKFFEEVAGLFLGINPEKRPENESRRNI